MWDRIAQAAAVVVVILVAVYVNTLVAYAAHQKRGSENRSHKRAEHCVCCPRWIEDFTPNPHPSTPCNKPGRTLLGIPFRVTDEL